MKRFMPLLLGGLGLWCGTAVAQAVITLDYPGGVNTEAGGIAGNLIVGTYADPNSQMTNYGYVYNLSTTTYTKFGEPSAGAGYGTFPNGISGNSITGCYMDSAETYHGFLYNLSTSAFITLDDPSASNGIVEGTVAGGISGSDIVGSYDVSLAGGGYAFHGFVYNLSTSAYTSLDDPLAVQGQSLKGTGALGISGNNVVGIYYDSAGDGHGFLYNISTKQYLTLDDPLAAGYTAATGIDGNTVFGEYFDATPWTSTDTCLFEYNIVTGTYTTLNLGLPGPIWLSGGISGNTVVGTYSDPVTDYGHGFVATVPEPSAIALLAAAALGLTGYATRKRYGRASVVVPAATP